MLRGHLKEKSLEELYDTVMIPALLMAEQDRRRNDLDEETATFIYQSTREFVDDLSEKSGKESSSSAANSSAKRRSANRADVICVPASGEADEIAGAMLAQLLSIAGHDVKCVSIGTVEEMLAQVERAQPGIICISAVSAAGADTCESDLRAIANAISVAADNCWVVELFRRRGEIRGTN